MFVNLFKRHALQRVVSYILSFVLILSLLISAVPATPTLAATGDSIDLLGVQVNKPVNAVVDLNLATIGISLPYGTIYQMLNVTTNQGAAATLYRSNETTEISFAASGINKGDAKLDQLSASGTTTYYLVVTDKNDSGNSRKYTITVTVDTQIPPIAGVVGANETFTPLNIRAGEDAWDVLGSSKVGNGSTTGSIEGPNAPSSYSGKSWSESTYDRLGDYPAASTVDESWLGDNMYLQTIGRNDVDSLTKYGIADIPGTDKLTTDILRYHEFKPFVTPDGVSRDDGDRGAVGSDRQRLEIKTNTDASNNLANSVGGDIMTHHWRLMLPSETLKFQQDVGDKKAGDFIDPHRFFHIFQLKEVAGNAAGQPVATLTLVSSDGKGQLEFRNNPDSLYADRIKPLFTIPFDRVVDRWLDMQVTILTADQGYVYGKLVDLSTGEVLFEGGMTAETYRRPEVANPITGRFERVDLPAEAGQQNRSKWGLYHGMYNGVGDTAYADEFQASTMYLSDVYLIKRDKASYVFPDGWDPKAQTKNVVAWARPKEMAASEGTAFSSLPLPSQLDVTMSTGNIEKVNVTWSSDGYNPNSTGKNKIYGDFTGSGFTNTSSIKPYIEVNLSNYKNWAVTPGAKIKAVSSGSIVKENFIDNDPATYWQANSSLITKDAGNHQYWAAVQLEKKIDISNIQIEWTNNSSYLKNYQVYYSNNGAAYDELVEGNNFANSSKGTEKPLETAHGSSWVAIPGAEKATQLSNNEKANHTLVEPVSAQYVLLVSDVNNTLESGKGVGIRSNVFNIFGVPSTARVQLNDLKVDGTTIANFAPGQTAYTETLSSQATTLPKIEAIAPAGMQAEIVYPTDYRTGAVTITVSDPSGAMGSTEYTINFTSPDDLTLVNSVTLNKNNFTLTVGATESLSAEVLPEEATHKTVTWVSDSPSVATVDDGGLVTAISTGTAVITVKIGRLTATSTVHVTGTSTGPGAGTGSVNLVDASLFEPQDGVNLKVSSAHPNHPGAYALLSDGSGYWRNSSPNVYMSNYSPSLLALALDLGAPKTIDKLHLEIPNTIPNIQANATRFEVYYSNSPDSWASVPAASDSASNYDWRANGWTLAGGTETEGLWSFVTYNGQQWGFDNKTFLFPFTARYVMINTVLVGPRDRRADDAASMMGLSGLKIYGKDAVSNTTALVPEKSTYSTWDQVAPIATTISLASGQSLTSVTKGSATLRPSIDYALSGNTVTLASAYLAALPLGTNEFTFNFNNGSPSVFALDVTARGLGDNAKTIKMNAIDGVSPYNVMGGAMGTDEPVEGVTKRIRDAYHAYYGDQPRATAADDHITNAWDSVLNKNVFKLFEYGRGLNNEFADKVRDGEYGHKGYFDWDKGYVVGGAAINDRQRVEIRPSEDSNNDFVAYNGDLVSYQWKWNIPDGNQWNQSNFRHIFQLKAVNAQRADTLPGGNTGGENGAYILAFSISGTTSRNLVVNHNRYDGDKNIMTIPLKDIDGHWIQVELNALISDAGWFTIKITDMVTNKVYTFDSPDVYQAFPNQGAGDGTKDLWRRPEKGTNFETEYPATFDQYERPKWGIYRSSNGGNNSAFDTGLQLSDITITKVASGISSVNLALNKQAYNVGPTAGANSVQMQAAASNGYGNANRLTTGVLQDPTVWAVTNVSSLDQIGNYSWLGTDGARNGSFVIDLGQAMDFSQIRLFAKSTRLKGATVYVSDDVGNHTSSTDFDTMSFTQVEKQTTDGYTFATGNTNGGSDAIDSSYPINLGKTYHSRYVKVTVENASGGNQDGDLTGPPRLTQVQVFNAPTPPQHVKVETSGSTNVLKWDVNAASEGFTVYNGTAVLVDLPAGTTSYSLPSNFNDLSKLSVRSKGTDVYSHKFMISAPTLLVETPVQPDISPKLNDLKVNGQQIAGFSPTVTSYTYNLNPSAPMMPTVTAVAAEGFVVKQIVYPDNGLTGTVTITVASVSDANSTQTYTILLVMPSISQPLTFPLQDYTKLVYEKNSSISISNGTGASSQSDWPSSVTGYTQLNGNTNVDDYVAFTLKDIPAGAYKVLFGYKTNNNRATLQLSVDGSAQGSPVDEYAASQSFPINELGTLTFSSAGDHVFKFTVIGKNAASSSQTVVFSFIQLVPLTDQVQIASILPTSITTAAGTAPVMPSVVTVVYSDTTTKQLPVVWNEINAAQYAVGGSFSVQGTVTGTTYQALATITVTQPVWPITFSMNATNVQTRSAKLQWTAAEASRGVTGYKIYSVTGNTYTEIASLGNVQTLDLTGLTPDHAYTYTVQAIDADGTRSVYGKAVSFRTLSDSSGSSTGTSGIGSTTTPVTDSTGSPGSINLDKDAKVTKETQADGRTVTKVAIDEDKLEKALTAPSVTIEVKGSEPTVSVQLPGNAILKGLSKQSNAVIQIQANGVLYALPARLFADIPKDAAVNITISQVFGQAADAIHTTVNMLHAKQVIANPIEFTITINGKENSDFGGVYVNRTISLGTTDIDASKITAVWVDSHGQIHFVPSVITTKNGSSEITFRSPHNSMYTVIQSNKSFADLQGYWAKADIELLANKWIVDGKTELQFVPEATVTRAEFAAMLVRSLGLAETKSFGFRDIGANDWYAGAVSTAYKAGLINGFEDGTFRPKATITREQMVVMMMRAMNIGGKEIKADHALLHRFSDLTLISSWSGAAVSQALAGGLIEGVTDTVFAPNDSATRAQAAVILKRMLQSLQFMN